MQKAPATIETIYMPTYIPEGYKLNQIISEREWVHTDWIDETNQKIFLHQELFNSQITIDNEHSDIQILYFDDLKILKGGLKNIKSYHWNTEEYIFSLLVPQNISDEEVFLIIKSLKNMKNYKNSRGHYNQN